MTRTSSHITAAIALALASTLGIAVTYVIAVHTRVGQLVDTRAMLAMTDALAGAAWTEALLLLVSPATVLFGALSLAAFAAALRGARAAAAVVATTAGTAVGAVLLKTLLVRPQLLDDAANSLPSGHVAAVAGLAAAAAATARPPFRAAIVAFGTVAVGFTGVATLALGWHRPSDVVAAALLALAVVAATTAVSLSLEQPIHQPWYAPKDSFR